GSARGRPGPSPSPRCPAGRRRPGQRTGGAARHRRDGSARRPRPVRPLLRVDPRHPLCSHPTATQLGTCRGEGRRSRMEKMTRDELFIWMRDQFAEILEVEPERVTEKSDFADLDADSIDIIEVVNHAEREFNIQIEEQLLYDIET